MKKTTIAERFQRFLGSLKIDLPEAVEREPSFFSKRNAAVLRVSMMIAALDGAVTDAELAAFEKQAKKCRGCNAQSSKALFREGLRAAGYLELAARTLSARELRTAFLEEVQAVLSEGVAMDAAGTRAAFVTWIAMAMADGDYSANERTAIEALADHVRQTVARRQAANRRRRSLAPAFAAPCREQGDVGSVLSPAFFAAAETQIARLDCESTAAAAAADLKALIAGV